jgi:hypothetical protein
MVRQQGQRDRSHSGSDLLNFHFSTAPPPQHQQQQHQQHHNSRRRNQHNNSNKFQHRKQQQNRSEPRRKPNSHMFDLHSSADHAFILARHGLKQQQYSFSGSDEGVSWESVRMVRYLVPSEQAEDTCCPICLDTMTCARITKCGHAYCLPCLLRHIQVHAEHNPYTHVKCPCCGVALHVTDLRPVVLATSLPPRLRQRMKLVKLHRTKDCPCPYLPLPEAPKRSSSHAAPCMTDVDAAYSRFNYLDPTTYQTHLVSNKVELEMELSNIAKQPKNPLQRQQAEVEAIFLTSSLDLVKREIQKSTEEFEQETTLAESYASVGSGVYQEQPNHLIASNYEFTIPPMKQEPQQRQISDGQAGGDDPDYDSGRFRGESMGSEGDSLTQRYRGDSIGSYDSQSHSHSVDGSETAPLSPSEKRGAKERKKHEFPKASMYLDNEGSTNFYQSEDGQLCFLSRFNMNCLLSDFSPKVPEVPQSSTPLRYWEQRKLLPLPDTVEGEILEIETVHLNPEMRKRMPFLAHLPLYIDIHFVELNLNRLLSMDTKKKFKADFEKRRKRRQSRLKAEKREVRIARKKEEERINELKARMQQIDPNDEFFRVSAPPEPVDLTGEAFGPAISGTHTNDGTPRSAVAIAAAARNNNPGFSFSNVCQTGASSLVNAEINFPSLGSTPPSRRTTQPAAAAPVWGSPPRASPVNASAAKPQVKSTWGSTPPSLKPIAGPNVTELSKQQPVPGPKKKSKGKKIVLFSTGGQRGTFN